MILQENHKEFTVKCFAEYMKPRDVVKVFLQEFENDLPKPSPPHITHTRFPDRAHEILKTISSYNKLERKNTSK